MPNQQLSKDQPVNSYKIVTQKAEAYTPEWFLLKYLDPWAAEDMQLAIRKDFHWDLGDWGNSVVSYVTDQVLNWIKTYRIDLYNVLCTTEGKAWLRRNILKMMTQI